jgi:DNA-binding response OmpR family regulator
VSGEAVVNDAIPDLTDIRALVAEDEPSLRELLDLTLTMAGAEVSTTETPDHAMELLDKVRPHIVLLNASMDHGGVALAEATRERKIPTIALTGRTDDPETAVALRQHGAGVLSLFDHVEVLAAVAQVLKRPGRR